MVYPYELLSQRMLENAGLKYNANEGRIVCLTSLTNQGKAIP